MDENGDETTQELHFFYDAESKPAFAEFEGEKYRYINNLQGDIIGIVDNSGSTIVEYKYDAWGNVLSIAGNKAEELGKLNIFGYRGYEWDIEAALYYLKSRYYNPVLSRFISSDTYIIQAIFKCNVYNYGLNAPIVVTDICGTEATYAVVLNVYGEDYLPGTGHYDISIISETGQNCVFSFGGKTFNTNSSGMTLSFGGMDAERVEVNGVKIQTGSRVDIFTEPERDLSKVRERFVLIEGLTQTGLDRFMNWFGTAYAVPGKYDSSKGKMRCKVWATGHTTYSAQTGPYCGSEGMFLVDALIASTYGTRARVASGAKSVSNYLRSGIRVVSQGLAIIREALKAYLN